MADISSNLLHYYTFDPNYVSGNTIKNLATNLYDATLSSPSVISNSNFYIGNSALNLIPEQSTNVVISSTSCFQSSFSISFWISSLNNKVSPLDNNIIEYSINNDVNTSFSLVITNNEFRISSTVGTTTSIQYYNININNGIWRHIIVSFILSTKILRLYMNGVLIQEDTLSNNLSPGASGKLIIGSSVSNTNKNYFRGSIDDFRIYDYGINIQTDINYLLYYPNYIKYSNSLTKSSLLSKFDSNFYDTANQNFIFNFEPRSILPGTIFLLSGDPITTTNNSGNYVNSATYSSIFQAIFNSNYSSLYIVDNVFASISIINMFTGVITFIKNPSSVAVENRYNLSTNIRSIAFDISQTYYYLTNGSYVQQMDYVTNDFIQNINTNTLTTIRYCITDTNNILYISHATGINKINLSGTLPVATTNVLTTAVQMINLIISPLYPNTLYAIDITNRQIYIINTNTNANYKLTLPASFMYTSASLSGICFDSLGNLYVSTTNGTYAVYMIPNYVLSLYTANQTLTTNQIILYAGIGGTAIGTTGFSGDGQLCNNALFKNISNISMDAGNNMYICDTSNCTVRKIINKSRTTNFLDTIGDEMNISSLYDISTLYSSTYSIGTNQISNYSIGDTTTFIDSDIKSANYNIIDNSGLLLYYRFNSVDASGVDVANYATGFPVYDASLSVTGLVNSNDFVLDNSAFNSSSQFITLKNSVLSSGSWPTTNGISVAFWVKSNNNVNGTRFFDFGDNYNSITKTFVLKNINNTLGSEIMNNQGRVEYETLYTINNNIYRHVCFTLTYSASTTSVHKYYIDGSLQSTITGAIYPSAISYSSSFIGASNFGDPNFIGSMDDFRLYNRILSDSEISTLYNMGTKKDVLIDLTTTGAIPTLTVVDDAITTYTFVNNSTPIRNGQYTTSASSTGGTGNRSPMAFDNSNGTYHSSSNNRYVNGIPSATVTTTTFSDTSIISGEWTQVKLPYVLKLTSYTVVNWPTYATQSIVSYVLAGSTDGTAWDFIDSVDMSSNPVLKFDVSMSTYGNSWTWTKTNLNKEYYNYYRFIGTEFTSGVRYSLAELKLFGIGQYYENVPITNTYTLTTFDAIPYLPSFASSPLTTSTTISGYVPSILNGVYTVSTSSSNNSSFRGFRAFDGINTQYWSSAVIYSTGNYTGTFTTSFYTNTSTTITVSGEWIQIKLPYSLSLSGYSMLPRSAVQLAQFPKSWYLVGSTDGTNWYAIDNRSNITPVSFIYYNFGNTYANTNYYEYFRIIVMTNNTTTGTSSITISEIQFQGTGQPL